MNPTVAERGGHYVTGKRSHHVFQRWKCWAIAAGAVLALLAVLSRRPVDAPMALGGFFGFVYALAFVNVVLTHAVRVGRRLGRRRGQGGRVHRG